MDYFVWQRTIVDEQGNVLPEAEVSVTDVESAMLAQLYSDQGSTGIGNPITADEDGFVQFYVSPGYYDIVATLGASSRTWNDEQIGSLITEIPVAVEKGGTGGETASEALGNLGVIDIASEQTISSATSLDASALGKAFAIDGTSADYAIELPSGAPVGSMIFFRVKPLATKLFTLTGLDVGMDTELTRVLWRNESCLLVRESNNWAKIGGRTIPFRGCLRRTGAQTGVTAGSTFVAVEMQEDVGDHTSLSFCFDAANTRFKSPRKSSFQFTGYVGIAATVGTADALADVALARNSASVTGSPATMIRQPYVVGQARLPIVTTGLLSVAKDDYIEVLARIFDGGGGSAISDVSFEYIAGTIEPTLSFCEVPQW